MKFYQFGKEESPVIMLFPGTCCHWKANFGQVIPMLEGYFHVICVSYDGFDETEKTEFWDMLTETEKIESYVQEKFNGHISAAYGCSLGGSFVGLLIQRKKIHVDHGILERYQQHFKYPDIRRHELQHEELLMRYPKEWLQEVLNCCGLQE